MMQLHINVFFLSMSKVLDKVKNSNINKKIIYGHR